MYIQLNRQHLFVLFFLMVILSCSKKNYLTNGETIYRTGKNKQGLQLLDRNSSQIKFIKSCQGCHGRHGDLVTGTILKYAYLTDPNKLLVPYTDSLIFRFLDKDLKSDSSKANIGVRWKIPDQDKKDLIDFLKSL